GCYPTISARIVSAARVKIAAGARSTPDNHFTVRPACRVIASGGGGVRGAGGCPAIRAGFVSPAGGVAGAPPVDHLGTGPNCGVLDSGFGSVSHAGGCPRVCHGVISAPGVKQRWIHPSTPDDHFSVSPHCCVKPSAIRCIGRAGGCPCIRAWVVFP